ncbi:MAG: TatD family hydrolase, partial [Thiothrix sp.]
MSKQRDIPVFSHPLIETHCHLDYLPGDVLETALQNAQAVNVERIITIGVSPTNQATVLQLATHYPQVWGTQGIHPHDAHDFDDAVENVIRDHALHPKICAIGEIGLDYYYDHSDRTKQRAAFERQLQIAIDLALPVVIHARDADADTQAILRNFVGQMPKRGVIHSFTAGQALAEYCLAEGFCLGFNGISTFNKADNVRQIAALTTVEQILLETD